jgi:hypothetical protein
MSWDALIGAAHGSLPHPLNTASSSSNGLSEYYGVLPNRNGQTQANSNRLPIGMYPHQESALQHAQFLEAHHNAVLQQIVTLQQHSQDIQNQEQALTMALLNEISQKSSNPIQALLQQLSGPGATNSFSSTVMWPEQTQVQGNRYAVSPDEAFLIHMHRQNAIKQQVTLESARDFFGTRSFRSTVRKTSSR